MDERYVKFSRRQYFGAKPTKPKTYRSVFGRFFRKICILTPFFAMSENIRLATCTE
jgi:hypothetical protein